MVENFKKHFFRYINRPALAATLAILPLVFIGFYICWITYSDLEDFTIDKRKALSQLSAIVIKERFDRLVDIGNSLASRVQFRKLISDGKWTEAIKILEQIPKEFPSIDRIFLTDPKGVLMADIPEFPGVRGRDFSFRDWYKGVSFEWKPYISEVYKRTAEPQYNVVAIAVPITVDALPLSKKILGILVMQIKLDTFLEWSRGIDVGAGGFVYFVDRNGNLVAHPYYSPQGEIVSFKNVPVVEKLLKGEEGVEVSYNPVEKEERLSAFSLVSDYSFGVVVTQPGRIAFDQRNKEVIKLAVIFLVFTAGLWVSAYLIFKNRLTIKQQNDWDKILLESSGDGVAAIDRSWNITLWNKAASELSGWSKEEVLGKPVRNFLKFILERDRTENIAFIEEAMLFGIKGIMKNNTLLIKKDGAEFLVGDSAAPIFDQDKKVVGAIIIFRDTSKERESQRLHSDFAYASHQFRTPVTKALWNIEVALGEKDASKKKENLKDAYLAVESINKLSSHLLEVSEIDQQKIILKIESVKLADLFDNLLKLAEKEAKEKNINIIMAPVSVAASIRTDLNLFIKALSEILENAIEYSNPGSEVKVNLIQQENKILIEIQDSGIGIPKDQQQLIFTKFFRGKNIPADSIGGGLGLYIAREYIKLLNGKIWFESEEGGGTTFSILL